MKLTGIKSAHLLQTEIDVSQCEIEHLTGISVEDQRMNMFKAGLDWVELMMGGDPIGTKSIPNTPEFWGFWKSIVWLHADKTFLAWARYALHSEMVERYELGFYYHQWHRISFDNEIINTPATDAGYHVVIKHLAVKR